MAFGFTLISNIIHGKIQWKLKAQGLRLWVVLKFKNPNKISSIEMLLIDEKCNFIIFQLSYDFLVIIAYVVLGWKNSRDN